MLTDLGVPYLGIFLKDLVIINEAKLPDDIKDGKIQGKSNFILYQSVKIHFDVE
jgi:hypothetical protein